MKKSLLAIALAVATMPFTTFAKAAGPQDTPAATTAKKTKKHVKKVKKTKHAAANVTPAQK